MASPLPHYTTLAVLMLQPVSPLTTRHMFSEPMGELSSTDLAHCDNDPSSFCLHPHHEGHNPVNHARQFGQFFSQRLPLEVKIRVFAYMTPAERFTCAAVCREWRALALDGSLWQYIHAASLVASEDDLLPPLHMDDSPTLGGHAVRSRRRPRARSLPYSTPGRSGFHWRFGFDHTFRESRRQLVYYDYRLRTVLYNVGEFLHTMDFRGFHDLMPSTLHLIAEHFTSRLRVLHLSGIGSIISHSSRNLVFSFLSTLLSRLESVRVLDLAGLHHYVNDDVFSNLNAPHLAALNVSGCRQLTGEGLVLGIKYGIQPNTLHKLLVHHMSGFEDTTLAEISACQKQLQHVSIAYCDEVTSNGVHALAQNSGRYLQKLNLQGCKLVDNDGIRGLAQECPSITHLDLTALNLITDAALMALSKHCHKLQFLDLEDCTGITDEGVHTLGRLAHLDTLSLAFCPTISDEAVCAMLEAKCVAQIQDMPTLFTPAMSYRPWRRLAVDNCPLISGQTLRVANMCSIREIDMWDCRLIRSVDVRIGLQMGMRVHSFWTWKDKLERQVASHGGRQRADSCSIL